MADSNLDRIATDWANLQPLLVQEATTLTSLQSQVASMSDPRAAAIAQQMEASIANINAAINPPAAVSTSNASATNNTATTASASGSTPPAAPTTGS